MYQALYRKYRPKTLDDVVGQDVIVKVLKNEIISGNLNHAYLFTGPRGTGKTSIAKILAKIFNCNDKEEYKSCEKCVSCTQINNKQSVDIIEIDAASNNGVDEIREIRNKVNLVPAISKYKVYIIDEVHMLTTGAFNALLKTLEEPPEHIIFILATTEPHKIPTTILSRCQRFDFKRINEDSIVKRLSDVCKLEKIDANESSLKEIATLSDGGMRDALSILDQVIAYSGGKLTTDDIHVVNGTITRLELQQFVEYIISCDLNQLLTLLNKYNKDGKNFVKIAEELLNFFKDLLIYQESPSYFSNSSYIKIYDELTKKIDFNRIYKCIEYLMESLPNIKNSNIPKFMMELTIIKMSHIDKPDVLDNTTKEILNSKKELEIKLNEKLDSSTVNSKKLNIKPLNKVLDDKILDQLKKIRINNTLALFDKKELQKCKLEIKKLENLLVNLENNQLVSIILDGQLKAASKKNLVFVYMDKDVSLFFNNNIVEIENVLKKHLNYDLCVISTDNVEWEKIKEEFNGKKKKYEYIEENKEIIEILNCNKNNDSNEITSLFNEIVEYN